MLTSLSYLNSSFFYTDNIDILKTHKDKINSNIFIVSPLSYNFTKNYKTFKGTSYELYYIDENKNFNQLTYSFIEGNGISINDDLCVDLNIDNKSLQDNENNELSINTSAFTTAFYNKKGVLHGINNLYVNDILINNDIDCGSIYSERGFLSLNKGLVFDLNEIKYYYDECKILNSNIDLLYNTIFNKKSYFKVGDYLYKTSDGNITSEPIGEPYMICVISSNILPDSYARFTLINRGIGKSKFSINNKEIPVINAFSSIPVYEKNYTNISSELDNIIPSKRGYFAIDRLDWSNNLQNKFNINEYYSLGSSMTYEPIVINWYLEPYYVNLSELYKVEKNAIFSQVFNMESDRPQKYFTVEGKIEYKDGFIGRYRMQFEYNSTSKRYELKEECLPLDINNYQEYFEDTSTTTEEDTNTEANSNIGMWDDGETYTNKYYNYVLFIPPNIFDLDTVYLRCYLAKDDSCTKWEPGITLKYENSVGLYKKFDTLQNHQQGGIKIVCYSSRYLLDKNPYYFGLFKPSKWETASTSDDGLSIYTNKIISINSSSFIKLNINKYSPVSMFVGNQATSYYMFYYKGIINNSIQAKINISYSFDFSYLSADQKGRFLNTGCIKLKRSDNKNFDFSQCLASVTFNFLVNNNYIENSAKIEFKINGNILESDKYYSSYPWESLQNIYISEFEYISDAQNTIISDYEFDNKGNILNKN